MKKQSVIFAIALVTVSLTGILATAVSLAGPGDTIKARIMKFYESRRAAVDRLKRDHGLITVQMCVDFYTTEWVDPSSDPHIAEGDQFVLVGPNPYSGIWQVTPVGGDHQWEHGHYQAVPTIDPDEFDIWTVNVKPHGSEAERAHYYRMEVESWGDDDGCPDYVYFHSLAHFPGAISLDPGHAGVER